MNAGSVHQVQQQPQGPKKKTIFDKSVFDPAYYAKKNPGLAKAGLTSVGQLKNHWANYGIKEGRQASKGFNSSDYLKINKDVAAAGLDTPKQAINHWLNHGMKEGRATLLPKNQSNDRQQGYDDQAELSSDKSQAERDAEAEWTKQEQLKEMNRQKPQPKPQQNPNEEIYRRIQEDRRAFEIQRKEVLLRTQNLVNYSLSFPRKPVTSPLNWLTI